MPYCIFWILKLRQKTQVLPFRPCQSVTFLCFEKVSFVVLRHYNIFNDWYFAFPGILLILIQKLLKFKSQLAKKVWRLSLRLCPRDLGEYQAILQMTNTIHSCHVQWELSLTVHRREKMDVQNAPQVSLCVIVCSEELKVPQHMKVIETWTFYKSHRLPALGRRIISTCW